MIKCIQNTKRIDRVLTEKSHATGIMPVISNPSTAQNPARIAIVCDSDNSEPASEVNT